MLQIMKTGWPGWGGFAFPSTTDYLDCDTGLDPENIKRVEMLARGRTKATGEHPEGQEGPKVDGER